MLDRVVIILVAVVLLAIGAGIFFWQGNNEPPRANKPSPTKLRPLGRLSENWAVTALDGKEVVTAGELRGKVLFINHWATGCEYCVAEMPSIQDLYQSFKDSNVVFLIVTKEDAATVQRFVTKKGWSLPIYLAKEDLPPVLQTRGIPATFIVNPDGEVVLREVGARDWNTSEVRALLKKIS